MSVQFTIRYSYSRLKALIIIYNKNNNTSNNKITHIKIFFEMKSYSFNAKFIVLLQIFVLH